MEALTTTLSQHVHENDQTQYKILRKNQIALEHYLVTTKYQNHKILQKNCRSHYDQ